MEPPARPTGVRDDLPGAHDFVRRARGGGKTDCAIGRQIYGAIEHGYKWNGLFIRKSYKYFAELRRRIFELIRFGLPAELKGSAQSTNYLRFENGAQIMLTVIESMDKAEFFQGQQFSEISIEEACQFPSSSSSSRCSKAVCARRTA